MYDYLIVGAGIYGATAARLLADAGKSVLVIDRRSHIAGNCYTERICDINVHRYGAHIFHTSNEKVWEFVTRFADFNDYVHIVTADYKGEKYSLPFNMNTFRQMWGVAAPEEAEAIIAEQVKAAGITEPENLEEQAIAMVGQDIYEKLVKGYTAKQWGKDCRELPAFIIKRLPLRMTYDTSYFDAVHQGIPKGGYTAMIERMLEGIDVQLETDYIAERGKYDALAEKVIYTGQIDELMGYCYGELEYRTVSFVNQPVIEDSFQGQAVVNYTDSETPWTRIIEHKWFEPERAKSIRHSIITREFSRKWNRGDEPFYPINDERNNELYARYRALADKDAKLIVGGRLGDYRYYDMDDAIAAAMTCAETLIEDFDCTK